MRWLITPAPSPIVATALLAIRLSMGVAFILHGLPKMQNPFGWMQAMGMETSTPGWLQAAAALTEVGGGALLIVGLLTRLAAAGLVCQMIAALALVHIPRGDPFVAVGQPSWELAVTYLLMSLLLVAVGAGAWSIDALLANRAGHAMRPAFTAPWGRGAAGAGTP
jgi:putative oxidoreductase